MHIVNAMFARGLGGIEQAFLDYCRALAMQGNRVTAIIHPKAAILPELQRIEGVSIVGIKNHGQWDILSMFYLRRLLKMLRPDACIVHGNRAVSLLKPAAKGICPVVGVTHNYSIKRLTKLDAVFALTGDLRQKLLESGLKPEKIFTIPNMIVLPANAAPRPLRDTPTLGAMGRFVHKKGFDVFLDALALLKKDGLDFRAILGGAGETEEALWLQAEHLQLFPQLEFSGWVADKTAFFNALDVFVLPSRHEPFGIVLLEAMAHGLPIVSTASEGPREIVTNETNALLTPCDDAQAMADAIKTLITNPEFAQKIAVGGLVTVREKYDMKVVGKHMQEALKEITSSPSFLRKQESMLPR